MGNAGFVPLWFPSSTLFALFYLGVSWLKPNIREKGTHIIEGVAGELSFGS